jgi:hypothetical protein
MPSTSAPPLGTVLADRYELTRHVGRRGVADVYEGYDRHLGRPVAMTVYRRTGPSGPSPLDTEVITRAAVHRPRPVQVYDAGRLGDQGYVVLELADVATLLAILDDAERLAPDAPTAAMAIDGGTKVMPAVLVPSPPEPTSATGDKPPRRALWLALAAVAVVVALIATQGGGGLDVPPPTTEPVAVTSQPPPTTTVPPTTTAPARTHPGKGKGHNKNDD